MPRVERGVQVMDHLRKIYENRIIKVDASLPLHQVIEHIIQALEKGVVVQSEWESY